MPWLWNSFSEYSEHIVPTEVTESNFRWANTETTWNNVGTLIEAVIEFDKASVEVYKWSTQEHSLPHDVAKLRLAHNSCEMLVLYGERILLFHKRLGTSHWVGDFVAEKDILEHWERYSVTTRIGSD